MLAITSQDLTPHHDPKKVEHLIYSAAEAGKKMPKSLPWKSGKAINGMLLFLDNPWIDIVTRLEFFGELPGTSGRMWAYVHDIGHLETANQLLMLPSQIISCGEAILVLELEIEVDCSVSIQQIHGEHVESGRSWSLFRNRFDIVSPICSPLSSSFVDE